MTAVTIHGIVKTSIVTGFTIAAALMWKDFFTEAISLFFPTDVLFFQFLGAVITTILIIFAIYITLKTEHEVDRIVHGLKKINKAKRTKILKEIKKEVKKVENKEQEEVKVK